MSSSSYLHVPHGTSGCGLVAINSEGNSRPKSTGLLHQLYSRYLGWSANQEGFYRNSMGNIGCLICRAWPPAPV